MRRVLSKYALGHILETKHEKINEKIKYCTGCLETKILPTTEVE
jgi:hypothetical protein